MIPIASKVPNPYAIAGSLVLQMSGKCPPTCPTGMLYDGTAAGSFGQFLFAPFGVALIGGVGILIARALKKKGSPTP